VLHRGSRQCLRSRCLDFALSLTHPLLANTVATPHPHALSCHRLSSTLVRRRRTLSVRGIAALSLDDASFWRAQRRLVLSLRCKQMLWHGETARDLASAQVPCACAGVSVPYSRAIAFVVTCSFLAPCLRSRSHAYHGVRRLQWQPRSTVRWLSAMLLCLFLSRYIACPS